MKREYFRWYSPALNRDMELLVFGHAGARVLAFPTAKGRFFDWESRGLVGALAEEVENGWLQLFCVDSVDAESWYNREVHPGARAYRQAQYDIYLVNEVLPFTRHLNSNQYLIATGVSFGAYQAATFGLKHPDQCARILAMSGRYDIRRFTGGFSDDYVYFNNPIQFIPNEYDSRRLEQLRQLDIILCGGTTDRLTMYARDLSTLLWQKGIWNALRLWDGWHHDWPFWYHMLRAYISGPG